MSFRAVCDACGAPSAPAVGICPFCKSVMVTPRDEPLNESVAVLREVYDSGEIEDSIALTMRMLSDPALQTDIEFLLLSVKIMIEAEAPIAKMSAALNQAFRVSPRHPEIGEYAAILDAKTKMEHGLRDLAEAKLQEIVRRSPSNAHASFLLGSLYFWEKRNPELAIRVLESTVRSRPQFLRAWGCLGALYRAIGNNDLAANAFRRCLTIEKDHSMRDFFEEQLKAVS